MVFDRLSSSVICISPRIQVRLSGLTLLNVHRDIPVDIQAAIDEFGSHHSRRMRLAEILCGE